MSGKAFLDTNIFVYMQSEPQKNALCMKVIKRFACAASTQVLSEICNVFTKKFSLPITGVLEIIKAVNASCEVSIVTAETIESALMLKERYHYSYYDSLILASALECECNYLFSEDMSDGQIIENRLEIVNIFTRPDIFEE
jgi:predicted nucleic acid-binding protein